MFVIKTNHIRKCELILTSITIFKSKLTDIRFLLVYLLRLNLINVNVFIAILLSSMMVNTVQQYNRLAL